MYIEGPDQKTLCSFEVHYTPIVLRQFVDGFSGDDVATVKSHRRILLGRLLTKDRTGERRMRDLDLEIETCQRIWLLTVS